MESKPKELIALHQQITASFRGATNISTEYAPYVAEYNARHTLAKIGFTAPIDSLDDKTAQIFLEIASKYSKLEDAKMKADAKKRR